MTPLLWAAALALPAFFVQTVLHESAHALTAVLLGGRITWFHPWPSLEGGRLRFGGTTWSGPARLAGSFWVYAAPRLLDALQLAALWWLPWSPAVFVARVAAAVDFTWNTIGIATAHQDNDAWRSLNALAQPWRRIWGWGTVIALPVVWLLAFLPGVP